MALRDLFRNKVEPLPPRAERLRAQVLADMERTRIKAEGDVTFTPALVQALALFDGTSASYGTVYRKLPPVRTVVDFLANAVADTPLKFYRKRRGGREEVTDHRLVDLIRRPSDGLTEFELKFGWVSDLAIYGQSYTRYMPSPEQLVPLPPTRVTPRGGEFIAPTRFDLYPPSSGVAIPLSASEVLHMHLYDPDDRRVGASKLGALKAILQEEVEASRNRSGFWQNSARTGGWIEYPPEVTLTDEQLDRLRESLQGAYAGAQNAGKTGILELGARFNADGFSPRESEFLEGRLFVLEATARVFNVPLALLSLTETATYAATREYHKQLYMDVLPPWYKLIASRIELQLFPLFTGTDGMYCEFEPDAKLWGDPIDRIDVVNKAVGRPHMTVREARNLENLPDRGNPDDDKLAIPVGPNLALEGEQTQLPLASVTPISQAQ